MTKANPPLIVVASMRHPRSSPRRRKDENCNLSLLSPREGSGTPSGMRQGVKGSGNQGSLQTGGTHQPDGDRGKGFGPVIKTHSDFLSTETQKFKRRPLVPLDDINGVPTNLDAGLDSRPSASQSPKQEIKAPLPTLQSLTAIDPEDERSKMGAGEKMARVRICASDLESRIAGLEGMIKEFSTKVVGVVKDFQVLRSEIDHFTLDYAAMDNDLFSAWESLEEEKSTTQEYIERARLAENELERVYSVIPPGTTVPSAIDDMQGQVVD
ncbi:hypothetical protein NMY22_g4266 [Coprinellus aureogranulatus]|nr:hypothetical protein NMY22_g4266 [Coprinellus aureogranulatus]